jgi:ubiquinone/menaquinone biosynthesis C-methylase UbiE
MKLGKLEKWLVKSEVHSQRVASRADRLMEFVKVREDYKFLEVGCGAGAVSKFIEQKFLMDVTGIDVDPELIEIAQKGIGSSQNIRFQVADATELPFEDQQFDVILSIGVMHHIKTWKNALLEIRRVLKPYGYFIYSDLIYHNWFAKAGKMFRHIHGITSFPELNTFFADNNFATIHCELRDSLLWAWYDTVCLSTKNKS